MFAGTIRGYPRKYAFIRVIGGIRDIRGIRYSGLSAIFA